jgi:hypothetical protein
MRRPILHHFYGKHPQACVQMLCNHAMCRRQKEAGMSDHPIVVWLSLILLYVIYWPWVALVIALFISWLVWYLSQVNRRD